MPERQCRAGSDRVNVEGAKQHGADDGIPMALPTRCIVPITPLAAPASADSTVATMKSALAAMNRPLPTPATRSGPRTSARSSGANNTARSAPSTH